jgi:hypothetical protein
MTTQTLHLIDEYLMQGGYTPGIDAETLEREAHLVAAAPDLLQALHDVDAYLAPQGDEEDVYNYIRAIIKGAISKAQGA